MLRLAAIPTWRQLISKGAGEPLSRANSGPWVLEFARFGREGCETKSAGSRSRLRGLSSQLHTASICPAAVVPASSPSVHGESISDLLSSSTRSSYSAVLLANAPRRILLHTWAPIRQL